MSMSHTDLDRLIALAGLYQAVHCVREIARQGCCDEADTQPLIHALFQIDAASTEAVFGPPGAVATGARLIVGQITGQPARDLELTRHVALLMRLERALAAHPERLERIGADIASARDAGMTERLSDPDLLARFAALYGATLSDLQPRLLIHGKPEYLRDPARQDRIRALLLAGIRCARLWRQIGGRRWQLLLRGRRLLEDARGYLSAAGT